MCNELIPDLPVLKVFCDPQTEVSARKRTNKTKQKPTEEMAIEMSWLLMV